MIDSAAAAAIKALIRSRGFASQHDFARAVGFDGPKLSHFLGGKRNLSFAEACRMADVLNLSLDELRRLFWEAGNAGS